MVPDSRCPAPAPSHPDTPRNVAGDLFSEVTDRLRDEPCVSYALICKGYFDYCPELDVAIRLLSIAARGRPVDHGRLIWGLQENVATPATMGTGKQAVSDCIELLDRSGVPFEFLAHVEGEFKIEVKFRSDEDSSHLQQLAEGLADEVRGLSG